MLESNLNSSCCDSICASGDRKWPPWSYPHAHRYTGIAEATSLLWAFPLLVACPLPGCGALHTPPPPFVPRWVPNTAPPPRQCLTASGQAELGGESDDEGIFLLLHRKGPSWDPSQSQRNPRAQPPASLNMTPDPDQGSPSLLWVTEALADGHPDLPSNCSSTSCHVPGTILGIRKKAKETQGWQARSR